MAAASTSDLAPILDARRKQFSLHALVPIFGVAIFALGAAYELQPIELGAALVVAALWPVAFVIDRRRRTTTLEYDVNSGDKEKYEYLIRSFENLKACQGLWAIPVEWKQDDWKRHAGATSTVDRRAISLHRGLPSLIKCNLKFPAIPVGRQTLYFAPDAILIVERNSVAALRYLDVEILASTTQFIEDDGVPRDAQVVDETWRYVNKKGGPDKRFSNNRKLPICAYGQLDFKSKKGLNTRMQCSRPEAVVQFAAAVVALQNAQPDVFPMMEDRSGPAKALTDDVVAAFSRETPLARALAVEHSKLWEFLLVQELLRSRLCTLKLGCEELQKVKPCTRYTTEEFINWLANTMASGLPEAVSNMTRYVSEDLIKALGEPGVAGDAIQILRTVDRIFGGLEAILTFERRLREAAVPAVLENLRDSLNGISFSIALDVVHFAQDWDRALNSLQNGSHEFNVKAVINAPPQLEKFSSELERIGKGRKRA